MGIVMVTCPDTGRDISTSLDDRAPDGVLAIEPWRLLEADEELAVAGIRILRACHRYGAAHMLFLGELGLELLAGATRACALGTTGLRHEAVDHAVEREPVV